MDLAAVRRKAGGYFLGMRQLLGDPPVLLLDEPFNAGLGVLAAWATAALLAGGLLLRLCDA